MTKYYCLYQEADLNRAFCNPYNRFDLPTEVPKGGKQFIIYLGIGSTWCGSEATYGKPEVHIAETDQSTIDAIYKEKSKLKNRMSLFDPRAPDIEITQIKDKPNELAARIPVAILDISNGREFRNIF